MPVNGLVFNVDDSLMLQLDLVPNFRWCVVWQQELDVQGLWRMNRQESLWIR